MRKLALTIISTLITLVACTGEEPKDAPTPLPVPSVDNKGLETVSPAPMTWTALSQDGTKLEGYEAERPDKFVGLFYFIWHGCHGYDKAANNNDVVPPSASDVRSPYNNEEIYKANPEKPAFGDFHTMHHWGEPYLGYYVSNDQWVIRKHAQMLATAGVDVIFFDTTNGFHYLPVVKTICEVFIDVRKKGGITPQVAFCLNSNTAGTFQTIYDGFYAPNLYRDLWFMWEGKPLVLADPAQFPSSHASKFTLRHSWFLYNNAAADKWFGSGEDKWPWGSWYPQKPGTHNGTVECVSVMPATHPHDNLGRSYDVTINKEPELKTPEKGIFFKAEFQRAMELDPKFMFFTGWNEWTAQRQTPAEGVGMIGGKSTDFGCYFVDQFNHEYSRDLEPVRGGFGDIYYYMLADFVRKFKGAPSEPVYSDTATIDIDGDCSDWKEVKASYGDFVGDTAIRNWYGWGRIGTYKNTSGRNDISLCKVTNDGKNLYFYVQCSTAVSAHSGNDWMRLYISTENSSAGNWEGFDFRINGKVASKTKTICEQSEGGFKWTPRGEVRYSYSGKIMEIEVPFSMLGIANADEFRIEFKWIDNAAGSGDIQTCMSDGDSAPDGRFRYIYHFKK